MAPCLAAGLPVHGSAEGRCGGDAKKGRDSHVFTLLRRFGRRFLNMRAGRLFRHPFGIGPNNAPFYPGSGSLAMVVRPPCARNRRPGTVIIERCELSLPFC